MDIERTEPEKLEDITGSDHLEHEWGERFRGWYRTMVFDRTQQIELPGDDLTYQFKVSKYQYRFIISPRVEFYKGLGEGGKAEYGIISYSEPERLFGIFRYPMDEQGNFVAPLSMEKIQEQVINLSHDEKLELLKNRKVLTFEAFKIPYFGFEYFTISDGDFEVVEKLAGTDFMSSIRGTYTKELEHRILYIKQRISGLPNYLLILQNVLDRKLTNDEEIAQMSGGIIHFGI